MQQAVFSQIRALESRMQAAPLRSAPLKRAVLGPGAEGAEGAEGAKGAEGREGIAKTFRSQEDWNVLECTGSRWEASDPEASSTSRFRLVGYSIKAIWSSSRSRQLGAPFTGTASQAAQSKGMASLGRSVSCRKSDPKSNSASEISSSRFIATSRHQAGLSNLAATKQK